MRKILYTLLFAVICSAGYGQRLKLNSELTSAANDPAVPEIAALWEKYIASFQSGNPDSVRTDLWLNGREDMIKYNSYKSLLYNIGEQYTFSIRKLTDAVYEINTIGWYGTAEDPYINCFYKVCAMLSDGRYKLLNYFDFRKQSLNKRVVGDIEYYYPAGVEIRRKSAESAARFVRDFKTRYGIIDNNPITYIVANSIDECSSILGLTYTEMRSENPNAGRAIYPRILLSARADHIHELVHAIMLPLYPEAPGTLHEGMATFYGGGNNKSYEFHAANLKKFLSENRIDLSDEVYRMIDGGTQLYNTLGALIIDYTLRNYGAKKVLELFGSKSYQEIYSVLGVPKDKINDFIYDTLIRDIP